MTKNENILFRATFINLIFVGKYTITSFNLIQILIKYLIIIKIYYVKL